MLKTDKGIQQEDLLKSRVRARISRKLELYKEQQEIL